MMRRRFSYNNKRLYEAGQLGNFSVPVSEDTISRVEARYEKYHWDAYVLVNNAKTQDNNKNTTDARDYIMKSLEPLWIKTFWTAWLGKDADQRKRRIHDAGGKREAWFEFYGLLYTIMFGGSGIGKDAFGKGANARAERSIISEIKTDNLIGAPLEDAIKEIASWCKKYALVPRLKDINMEMLSGGMTGVSIDSEERPSVSSYDPSIQAQIDMNPDTDDYSRNYDDPTYDDFIANGGDETSDDSPFIVRWNGFARDERIQKVNAKGLGPGVCFRLVLENLGSESMNTLAKKLGLNYTTLDQNAKKAAKIMQSDYNIDLADIGEALQSIGATKLFSKLPMYVEGGNK